MNTKQMMHDFVLKILSDKPEAAERILRVMDSYVNLKAIEAKRDWSRLAQENHYDDRGQHLEAETHIAEREFTEAIAHQDLEQAISVVVENSHLFSS